MEETQAAAVYVSWATFKNAVEGLAQGVPNIIDRSTFPGLSGGVQSQLLAGLKFLGLIDDNNKPTADLLALAVPDEAARKEKLKEILQKRYAELFALDLVKTTPIQLNSTMGERYNVSGDTKDKAVRFFLSAVSYVGIPVSRLFNLPGGNGPSSPRQKRKAVTRSKVSAAATNEEEPQVSQGQRRTVTLASGGTLTLSATVDFFSMSQQDRTFVFKLIDEMEKYEKGTDLV